MQALSDESLGPRHGELAGSQRKAPMPWMRRHRRACKSTPAGVPSTLTRFSRGVEEAARRRSSRLAAPDEHLRSREQPVPSVWSGAKGGESTPPHLFALPECHHVIGEKAEQCELRKLS